MEFPGNFFRLTHDYNLKPFDCGDDDLNNFFFNDSKDYLSKLLAVTYLIEDSQHTIAFFCLLNDKVSIEQVSNNQWKRRFKNILPASKHFKSYPAVKIGRLGVNVNHSGKGIGKALLDYIKVWFVSQNKTGCMYITVDAYKNSLQFYEKSGF